MAVYIGGSINSGPSDQTDLIERRRCNLGGSGEPTFEGGADRWAQGAAMWGRSTPPIGQPAYGSHQSASALKVGFPPPLRSNLCRLF